jgi:hypothetical protein
MPVSGTLYSGASSNTAVKGATIIVKDKAGKTFKLITASNGNFFSYDKTIQFPVAITASKCPDALAMTSSQSSGDCNSCHTSGQRIHLP